MSENTIKTSVPGMVLKDSGKRLNFDTGASRDCQEGKGRMDLLPPWAIEELSKLYEAGCAKYGDRNWEKGIPLSRYFNSGIRHAIKALRGDADENHLLAACWNFMCALDTRERIKLGLLPGTLDDLPKHALPKAEENKPKFVIPMVYRFPHGMGVTLVCPKHSRYLGRGKPRSECARCWKIWNQANHPGK